MDKVSIHICGGEDHKCDSNGTPVLLLDVEPFEVPETEENHQKYKDAICGGSVTCSQCGKSAFSQAWLIGI